MSKKLILEKVVANRVKKFLVVVAKLWKMGSYMIYPSKLKTVWSLPWKQCPSIAHINMIDDIGLGFLTNDRSSYPLEFFEPKCPQLRNQKHTS